jgi:putative transposase
MNNNKQFPQRKSPRLRDYDYAQEGAYFVTVCVQRRLHLFGQVVDGDMRLNPAGSMVADWWQKLPGKFPDVDIDLYVVMPNHFHGIVIINRPFVGGHPRMPPIDNPAGGYIDPPLHRTGLSDVIQWFKIMTTNHYIRGVKSDHWLPFPGKIWQRSYHDHIIRNEKSLNKLREYTLYNPTLWEDDRFYSTI